MKVDETDGARTVLEGAGLSAKDELIRSGSLDLTRYKTDELRRRFEELYGFKTLIPWAVGGMGVMMVLYSVMWAMFFAQAPFFVAVVTLFYMTGQGVFLGIMAASILVVARVLQQIVAIVDITLQTIRQALTDLKNFADDKQARAELMGGLVHAVILPTVQKVITVKLGFLKLPVSWVINRVLKRMAKKLTKLFRKEESKLLVVGEEAEAVVSGEAEETHLDRLQKRIEKIAYRTRVATLVPSTLLFLFVMAVSNLPWVVLLFFV